MCVRSVNFVARKVMEFIGVYREEMVKQQKCVFG